jgi:hypothetical protein
MLPPCCAKSDSARVHAAAAAANAPLSGRRDALRALAPREVLPGLLDLRLDPPLPRALVHLPIVQPVIKAASVVGIGRKPTRCAADTAAAAVPDHELLFPARGALEGGQLQLGAQAHGALQHRRRARRNRAHVIVFRVVFNYCCDCSSSSC